MIDLISRQAALDNAWQVMYKDEWHMTQTEQVVSVNDIEALPTIDPVRHGKWIAKRDGWNGGFVVCSVCSAENGMNSRFCPHCGARMDGE